MARVTVEDCAEVVPSRFELVALASHRARNIASGGQITVDRHNDKNAVIALREIAQETIDIEHLREGVIQNCQEKINTDEYGVEEITSETQTSNDAIEEISSLQPQAPAESSSQSLYGEDDVEVED